MSNTSKEALQQALEALDHNSLFTNLMPGYDGRIIEKAYKAINKALAEQPAQPEGCQCPACKVTPHTSDCAVHNEPAYPKGGCNCGAQPEHEPEFFTHNIEQPEQPQQKPLTNEKIEEIAAITLFPIEFARAIEAAHGIKENT